MLAAETTAAEPLVGPYVRRNGKTIIGAHGGDGKTTMGTRIMHAHVAAEQFLGYRGSGGTGLIIDVEQNMASAQRQVMQAMYPGKWERSRPTRDIVADLPRIESGGRLIYALWPEGIELGKEGVDIDVVGELIDRSGAELVMPDPVYKLMMGNPNEAETIMGFIQQWDRLREQLGFATLLPMHPRKPPAQGGGALTMHDLYGHAHWSWWAEQIFMIKRTPGSNAATFRIEKDREAELVKGDVWTLVYDEREGYSRLAGDADDSGKTLPGHEQIWRLLQREDVGGRLLSREDITKMIGMPADSVIKNSKKLEERHGQGQYEGLVVEVGAHGRKLYGYSPSDRVLLLDRIEERLAREFGAEEE